MVSAPFIMGQPFREALLVDWAPKPHPGSVSSEVVAFMAAELRSEDPVPLRWQPSPSAEAPAAREVQDADFCPLCKSYTVGSCQTIQDMRACRNLDEAEGEPGVLVPV
jgi:hypothetical protein